MKNKFFKLRVLCFVDCRQHFTAQNHTNELVRFKRTKKGDACFASMIKTMDKLEQLKKWVEESENIVFFGGAGVSTESGIPDFRSVDGLYNQKYKYPPETILSRTFFCDHLDDFYEFYRDKLLCLDAKPNKAHLALAS